MYSERAAIAWRCSDGCRTLGWIESMPKVTLTIDGQQIEADLGKTIIQAAHEADITIPYYCYHPGLVPDGNCRICLVEVEKAPKLMVACKTGVTEGMGRDDQQREG